MSHPQPRTSASAGGLTVAVIGLGRMGARHVQAAQGLGMRVVGLADVSTAALQAACQAHGVNPAAAFTDASHMLVVTRPQALVVATTAPTHHDYVLAAVEAGARHILCEKPMASSIDQADRMIEACAAMGVGLAVNHQMSFMAQYTQVKALIGSAELGPLASIVVAGSNFGLAMNASHYFEMFRYIVGEDVESVRAWLEPEPLANPRGAQFDDRSGRLLALGASGVSMFIDFSAAAGWGLQVVYICRHGQIVVDELNGHMRVAAREEAYRSLPTTRYGMPANVHVTTIAPADTVGPTMAVWSALLEGQHYPAGAAGRHALACLVAAHVSHQQDGAAIGLGSLNPGQCAQVYDWA